MLQNISKHIFSCCIFSKSINFSDENYNGPLILLRPNTSIRYYSSDLRRRINTESLSLLPHYHTSLISENSNIIKDNSTIIFNIPENQKNQFANFTFLLYRGVILKQVLDLCRNETRDIALYLSKDLKYLKLDNFSGVILEISLKSIIDIRYNIISGENKSYLTKTLHIESGYEPVSNNNNTNFTILIDVGDKSRSVLITFNQEDNAISFYNNIKLLIQNFQKKNNT
ncbi:hypothetical protein ACR3K2_25680 [Cryptosporidium serpentis]